MSSPTTQENPKYKERYGIKWPGNLTDLKIELYCFRLSLDVDFYATDEIFGKAHPNEVIIAKSFKRRGFIHPAKHFKVIAKTIFPKFIWHPWADWMLEAHCQHKYVGVAGCSHIGKSEFAGIWSIINYLAMPPETLVLITSSSLAAARKRVWSAVERLWTSVPNLPGKLVNSPTPEIRFLTPEGKVLASQGISLIPSDPKKSAEITNKMQGMKSCRVFLVADELADLSHSLVETAMSNLSNNSIFRMSGYANPVSYYDPSGLFFKPKNGYGSIHVDMDEWETAYGGICLHMDAYKSPNYLEGKNKWPILGIEKIQAAEKNLGVNTPRFWQMYRGFWCPSGVSNRIYPETDIENFGGFQKPVWKDKKIKVAGLDPAFTSGGDRTILIIGEYGEDTTGKKVLAILAVVEIREDVTNTTESRDFQIARQVKLQCESYGVDPSNFAVDSTGAGISFASIIEQTWSSKIHRVSFGGAASDLPTPQSEGKPAKDLYANRVSELYMVGLEFLRAGQIRGITPELARDMGQREYEPQGSRLRVEAKSEMRARGLPSPDVSDAYHVMLALCRERLGMSSAGIGEAKKIKMVDRKALMRKFNTLYSGKLYGA